MMEAQDFSYIRKLVFDHSAIVLEVGKEYLVETRIAPLSKQHGFESIAELVAHLRVQDHGPLHESVIDAMTTNETSFFRDIHPFQALKEHVLPGLEANRPAFKRQIHVWSAACSSGQEPYSLSMLLHDYFADKPGWRFTITASDISDEMLSNSREGSYTQFEINRGLPASMMVKYFENKGAKWVAKDLIKSPISFRKMNLSSDWPAMAKMDVVFLRNVLIYFGRDTKSEILHKVSRIMDPEGYLFLGSGETTLGLCDQFERVFLGKTVCYRLRK